MVWFIVIIIFIIIIVAIANSSDKATINNEKEEKVIYRGRYITITENPNYNPEIPEYPENNDETISDLCYKSKDWLLKNQISFVALDFETATEKRSSVCEIGLAFVENGKIIKTKSWLVKPQNNYYNSFNMALHGISPADTADKPEFNEVWKEIRPLIENKIIVAHYAAFDICVLRDVLDLYGLEYPNIKYFCSCTLAKKAFPELEKHKLGYVCEHLGIPHSDVHRVEQDSNSCSEVVIKTFIHSDITDFDMLAKKYSIYLRNFWQNNITIQVSENKIDNTSPKKQKLSIEEEIQNLKNASANDIVKRRKQVESCIAQIKYQINKGDKPHKLIERETQLREYEHLISELNKINICDNDIFKRKRQIEDCIAQTKYQIKKGDKPHKLTERETRLQDYENQLSEINRKIDVL